MICLADPWQNNLWTIASRYLESGVWYHADQVVGVNLLTLFESGLEFFNFIAFKHNLPSTSNHASSYFLNITRKRRSIVTANIRHQVDSLSQNRWKHRMSCRAVVTFMALTFFSNFGITCTLSIIFHKELTAFSSPASKHFSQLVLNLKVNIEEWKWKQTIKMKPLANGWTLTGIPSFRKSRPIRKGFLYRIPVLATKIKTF